MINFFIGWIRFIFGRCSECGTKFEYLSGFWGGCAVCPRCDNRRTE